MASRPELRQFVRDALEAGRDRVSIAEAMVGVGWSRAEAETALAA